MAFNAFFEREDSRVLRVDVFLSGELCFFFLGLLRIDVMVWIFLLLFFGNEFIIEFKFIGFLRLSDFIVGSASFKSIIVFKFLTGKWFVLCVDWLLGDMENLL